MVGIFEGDQYNKLTTGYHNFVVLITHWPAIYICLWKLMCEDWCKSCQLISPVKISGQNFTTLLFYLPGSYQGRSTTTRWLYFLLGEIKTFWTWTWKCKHTLRLYMSKVPEGASSCRPSLPIYVFIDFKKGPSRPFFYK